MFKHAFNLRSGQSLDDPAVALTVYVVRRNGARVEVALP
jgi:nitrite reductase/ring-hydroxylating ferredoxin subunit